MLNGIHILLTLKCTNECDHCFLHCGPTLEASFTLPQLRALLRQIEDLGTIDTVYFEGGEPFLLYPLLLEGIRIARSAGFAVGIVSNCYWAASVEDALLWLKPLADLGVEDLSISDDEFHRVKQNDRRAGFARQAAHHLGIPVKTVCIDPPSVSPSGDADHKGKPVIGGSVLFKGRAAEKLTLGLPVRPSHELVTCPHEDLLNPERVHIDAYGSVHICQALTIGNIWETPLAELVRAYDPYKHPIVGPLLRGGPSRLAAENGISLADEYVDECHLCYTLRKQLLPRFPACLSPRECYGLPIPIS